MLRTGAARLPRRWWVGAGCALAVLIAALATYVVVTPIGEQRDELAHLGYAQLISKHLALPTDGIQERQQPPLYYAIVAAILRVSGDNLRVARLASVALVVITAILIALTLRVLLPRRPWVALSGLWLFALLPVVQYEGAQVSNDNLAWLAGAAVLLVLVLSFRRPRLSLGFCAAVGCVVGLSIMSKATVWPLAALLVVAVAVRHGHHLRSRQYGAIVLPVIVISGWWVVRNLTTFHRPLPPFTPLTTSAEHTLRTARQLTSWVSLSWKSTVGIEGPQQTPLVVGPGRVGLYLLTLAGVVVAATVVVAIIRERGSWMGHGDRPAAWLLAAPLLAVVFSLVNSITLDDEPQARYLLVAATVWCGGTAWAWTSLLAARPRLARALVAMVLTGMLVLDAATVQTMRLIS